MKISFPEILSFDISSVKLPSVYVGAAGFEDRSRAVLKEVQLRKTAFTYVIGIEYEPFNSRNRKSEFQKLALGVVQSENNVKWAAFDREKPGDLDTSLDLVREVCSKAAHVYVDISAMSKFLILVLLNALKNMDIGLTILYAEAADYRPDRSEFEVKTKERAIETLHFLTSGVLGVITTPSLSSVTMQSHPVALVAFPTFNSHLLSALLMEIAPQDIILIEGEPLRDFNKWRQDAIKKVNAQFYSSVKRIEVASTFYYEDTIKRLEKLYEEYKYTHEFVIAPANSKLQTVGVFLFKQMHPEVQIAYPTPKSFLLDQYTKGVEQIYQIVFPNFQRFIQSLDGHRYVPLSRLGAALSMRTLKPRQLALLRLLMKFDQKGLRVNEPTLQRFIYLNDRRLSRTRRGKPLYGKFIRTQFGPFNDNLFTDIRGLRQEGVVELDDCVLTLTKLGRELAEEITRRPQALPEYLLAGSTNLTRVYPLKPMMRVSVGSTLP